jgi:hypothetical protein
MAVDASNPPFGPGTAGYQFDFVLHVVRHPLKVIASVAQFILQHGVPSPEYIEQHAPATRLSFDECRTLEPKQQLILRAARYWYHWNRLAERKADQTVQIEQLLSILPDLCRQLDIEYRPGRADKIPQDTNARWLCVKEQPWTIKWLTLEALDPALCTEIRGLAAAYGYSPENTPLSCTSYRAGKPNALEEGKFL